MITEDGAEALYVGVATQAVHDLRKGTETDKHTAWEFLRNAVLDRQQQLKLLSQVEQRQKSPTGGDTTHGI